MINASSSRVSWFLSVSVLGMLLLAGRPALADRPIAQERTPIRVSNDITIEPLAPGVWRFVAMQELPEYGRTPANGLIVVAGREALLVNTGWNDAQAAALADYVERSLGARVTLAVPTHAHDDTTGGLAELHRRGALSWGAEQTLSMAKANRFEAPRSTFSGTKHLQLGGRSLRIAFHGAGHTRDNIVVWLPAEKVLFGGCLVKAAASTTLGNLADAVVEAWPATMRAVMAAYPDATVVIPGHGQPGGLDLLAHTLKLAEAQGAKR